MEKRSDIALQKFTKHYNCAQSVFYAFCEDLGVDKEMALKLACGFGGGMGRKQEVCGAVTGAILVIGAKYGRGEQQDRSATHKTYEKTRELIDRFVAEQGTFVCRRLLHGCDLSTEEGQKYRKELDLLNRVCKPCVLSAVGILEEIL